MRFVIMVRRSEDWDNWNVKDYLDYFPQGFSTMSPDQMDMFIGNVKRWSEQFWPPFTTFRARMHDIAKKNWSRLKDADLIYNDYSGMTRDDIILPTDDDDWFNPILIPSLAKAFEEHPDAEGFYWDCYQYQCVNEYEHYCIYREHEYGTNSYALRGGYPWEFYSYHTKMPEFDKSKLRKLDVPCLSVYVNRPASFWMNQNTPITEFRPKRVPRPKEYDWAVHEIEAVYSLVRSVESIKSST